MNDRILEVLNHKRKCAVFPIVGADHCAHLLNENFFEVANNGENLARVLEYGYKLYNYDMVLVFSDMYVEAQAMGCTIEFAPYPRLAGPFQIPLFPPLRKGDKRGIDLPPVKKGDKRGIDPPPVEKGDKRGIDIPALKKGEMGGFKRHPKADRTKEIIKAALILKKKVNVPIFVSIKGPFSLASFLVGPENFLRMLITDEKKARKFIDQALCFQLDYLDRLLNLEVNIFIGDPMASASIISEDLFSKYAEEPLKFLVRTVKEKGLRCGIHICGETKAIITALDNLGADILSIEDITVPTRTLKMGGVNTATILNGEKTAIEKEIETAKKEPYLILSTSCDVPVKTKPESVSLLMQNG